MDKEPTKIRLILKLTSAVLTPEELSARLGVDFDTCHRIGEPRGKTAKFWTENWWKISESIDIDLSKAYDELPLALDRLMSRVEPRSDAFAALAANEQATLSIVIYSGIYPGMGFDSKMIARLARLNVFVDFDLYCGDLSGTKN